MWLLSCTSGWNVMVELKRHLARLFQRRSSSAGCIEWLLGVIVTARCGNRFRLSIVVAFVDGCCVLFFFFLLQIFEGVVNLLDRLKAWHSTPGSPGNTELKEMAQIGLRIIMGYIRQQHSPVSCTKTPALLQVCRK